MIVRYLGPHSPRAVREALRTKGWDEVKADAAAAGMASLVLEFSGLGADVLETLVRHGGALGLEVLTGDDWAVVGGTEARLGALARPWVVPPPLAELAMAMGQALTPDQPRHWVTARGAVQLDHPLLVGILNVTPDSFSDGGRFLGIDAALAQTDRLVAEGAELLDIGGESTRPGSAPVPDTEELDRILPVLSALVQRHPGILLSVDTVKASVARAALDAGAAIINDVSGLRLDPGMGQVVAQQGAGVILMHSRGTVSTMARLDHAEYDPDVVTGVSSELRGAVERAETAGIGADRIVIDPGFGFAKSAEQNLLLLDQLGALKALARPILVGPSRKRFLGSATGRDVGERDAATAAACVLAFERGARLFRVHNVALVRDALAVAQAVRGTS